MSDLLERYRLSPNDRALRREVARHVVDVLHGVLPTLGPSFSREGVGIGKSDDGSFHVHAAIRHRTKVFRTGLDLVLDGFTPDRWPAHGPLQLTFRLDTEAGGTRTTGYVYTQEDELELRRLGGCLADDGYALSSAAAHGFAGACRLSLCARSLTVEQAALFSEGAAITVANLLAAEHRRVLDRTREYMRTRQLPARLGA